MLPVLGMVGVFWERTLGVVGRVGRVVSKGVQKSLCGRRLGENHEVKLWGNGSKTLGKCGLVRICERARKVLDTFSGQAYKRQHFHLG